MKSNHSSKASDNKSKNSSVKSGYSINNKSININNIPYAKSYSNNNYTNNYNNNYSNTYNNYNYRNSFSTNGLPPIPKHHFKLMKNINKHMIIAVKLKI